MFGTIFGKQASEKPTMASSITSEEFRQALDRYPQVLSSLSKPPKEGGSTLEELDQFRYVSAPMAFSKNTGGMMGLDDLKKLIDWKMRHGTWRPTLTKLVAKNSDEKISAALEEAFKHYAANEEDIAGTLERITKPLSGIGPAAGSLVLAVHDPANVVYFSDELYRWLCAEGEKVSPKYTTKEFQQLFDNATAFMSRIQCTPIELEQAAFVLIKEAEPVYEPAPKKEPTGRPRGRPAIPDSEKKTKQPTGRARGRPLGSGKPKTNETVVKKGETTDTAESASGKKRGRPAKQPVDDTPVAAKKRGRPSAATATTSTPAAAGKKRGRPAKDAAAATPATGTGKKRGRPAKSVATPATGTSTGKKRGRPAKAPVDAEDAEEDADEEVDEDEDMESPAPAAKKRKSMA